MITREIKKRIGTSLVLAPLFLITSYLNNIFFYFLLISIFFISLFEVRKISINLSFFFLNILLVIIFIFSLYFLRGDNNNSYLIFLWVALTIFFSDIGGFIFGKFFKGKKLTKISPKKTYSGAVGSFIFSLISIYLVNQINNLFFLSSINIHYDLKNILTTLLFSFFCQVGDIYFSFNKRNVNLKDTGKLLPGHGGILDRIDGMIFVFIFAMILKINNFI